MINRLSELYDPYDYLPPKKLGWALCSYEQMRLNEGKTRSFILDYIPTNCIPEKFTYEASYLNMVVTCFELLCINPNDIYDDMDNFMYSSIIEMIHTGKQPPEEYIDLFPVENLNEAVDNFNKYIVLYRFFKNKGQVFYNNDMQLINLRLAKYVNGDIPMMKYFMYLENDDVLRRARHNELLIILATYKKSELEGVFAIVKPLSNINVKSLTKREIIKKVFESGEEIQTELIKSFFTLNDKYQSFKIWMSNEMTYFRVYLLFYTPVATSLRNFGKVMRELIETQNDYLTARRLGELYFRVKKSVDLLEIPGDDHGEGSVATLITRIDNYFN